MDQKQQDEEKCLKTKSIIEFDSSVARSIKNPAVKKKKNDAIKPTTRSFSGKMMMFAKVSQVIFTYEFTETFFFPYKKTRGIYDKYMIERVLPYGVLTDTDSICIFFIFICKPEGSLPNAKFRDVLFEVIVENEILHRFDISHKFWERYSVRNASLKKKARLILHRKY